MWQRLFLGSVIGKLKSVLNKLDVEYAKSSLNIVKRNVCTFNEDIPVYDYSIVPEFALTNPYLLRGYRPQLSYELCIKSIFLWTNETLNIWTHLIGFILIFFIMIYDLTSFALGTRSEFDVFDQIMLTGGQICFQVCLLCSVAYHIFRCHSAQANARWLAIDLKGILIGMIGCYAPGLHIGFYCFSILKETYFLMFSLIFLIALFWSSCTRQSTITSRHYISLNSNIIDSTNSNQLFNLKLFVNVVLVALSIVPLIHFVYLNGIYSAIVKLVLYKIFAIYILCTLALGFYLSKFPECCYPGRFDYVGSSHQFWHVFIVLVFLWSSKMSKEILLWRKQSSCH